MKLIWKLQKASHLHLPKSTFLSILSRVNHHCINLIFRLPQLLSLAVQNLYRRQVTFHCKMRATTCALTSVHKIADSSPL